MEGIVKLILSDGIWVLVVGLITSIIIGIIKTPIRKKVIYADLEENVKKKRENIFDTVVFLNTFVFAFLGAMVYYLILNKAFDCMPILELSLSVWLAQSMVYGIWKKLGLKRFLGLILKLFIKDDDEDGQISLNEVLKQVKSAYKNGKLDVDKLLSEAIDSASDNLEEVLVEATDGLEPTDQDKAVEAAVNGEAEGLVEEIKEAVVSVSNALKTGVNDSETEVVVAQGVIKVK